MTDMSVLKLEDYLPNVKSNYMQPIGYDRPVDNQADYSINYKIGDRVRFTLHGRNLFMAYALQFEVPQLQKLPLMQIVEITNAYEYCHHDRKRYLAVEQLNGISLHGSSIMLTLLTEDNSIIRTYPRFVQMIFS